MEVSPFPHQGPLSAADVVGRDDFVDDLVERVTERRVTALLGPRRYGKTSLLRKVAAVLSDAGTSVVWVDTYEASSLTDVAARLDAGMSTAHGPVLKAMEERTLTLGLRLGLLHVELSRKSAERPDPIVLLHGLLDTLVAAALRHPTVVIFDEFGGAFNADGFPGLLRTKLQHHFQEIGLLFAGSQPTLMRRLFSEPDMPFYAQADLVEVLPFDRPTTVRIINDGFSATGRDARLLGTAIHEFTSGHPHRVMQIADAAWRQTAAGSAATDDTWAVAIGAVRHGTALANESLFSTMAPAERSVLRLAAGGESLFGTQAELLGLSSSSAYAARRKLTGAGVLRIDDDGLHVVDPVFAEWIRNRMGY